VTEKQICEEDLGQEWVNIVRENTWPGTKKGCYVPTDGIVYTFKEYIQKFPNHKCP